MEWLHDKWLKLYWYFHGPIGHVQPRPQGASSMSLIGLINLLVVCVILYAVGWVVLWVCRRFGMPADLYSVAEIVVWVVVGASICIKLLLFAGIV
jgi:hypothetical protein